MTITPEPNGRWETVKYALGSWPLTIRLILVLLIIAAPPVTIAFVTILH